MGCKLLPLRPGDNGEDLRLKSTAPTVSGERQDELQRPGLTLHRSPRWFPQARLLQFACALVLRGLGGPQLFVSSVDRWCLCGSFWQALSLGLKDLMRCRRWTRSKHESCGVTRSRDLGAPLISPQNSWPKSGHHHNSKSMIINRWKKPHRFMSEQSIDISHFQRQRLRKL